MNEIKKTLATLKARWPEVTLLISIFMLAQLVSKLRYCLPEFKKIYPIVGLSVLLVFVILQYGFLRTVYLENDKRQSIMTLFQIGKKFFWRMFEFSLLCMLPFFIAFIVLNMIFKCPPNEWTWYFIGWMFLLIKIMLLVPALIFVFDIGISESFKKLKYYKLLNAKPLIILYLIHIAPPLNWFVLKFIAITTVLGITLQLVQALVNGVLLLMIAVTAIRFVSTINLRNDESL